MGLADSKHFLHVVHAMAADPALKAREVSERTGTPLPTTHRIVRYFRFHRAMPRGRFDVRRGLRLAADLRRDKALPDRTFHVKDPDDLLLAIRQMDPARHHLAFASAANAIARFEPADTHVRVDALQRRVLSDLKRLHAPAGRSAVHLYVDHLERYPKPLDGIAEMPICDPIVTLIDLLSHPTGGAHAEFLDRTLTLQGTLPERPG